ncbi:hypothetical protein [Dysgonomonas capnocytophagoides]|uniref:hypothetical protein n=1 Tax=Dysgonomonas capnocytophagoides TaxID=45254 RepID=UPI002926F50A|nr:hypothetical protein DCPSUM001_33430 [Dysgonomonas capnocytophagoides]
MRTPLFTTGNNFPSPEFTVGGGRPVYYEIGKELPGGFNIDLSAFPKGSVVQTGSPISVDEATRTAKLHIAVSVFEAAIATATEIKVKKLLGGVTISAGQFVIKAPATTTGTATSVTVSSIDSSNSEYDVLTLSAAIGVLAVGDILVEADVLGAGAKIKVVPSALTRYDIYADPTSTTFTCGAVIEGIVYERRIPPVASAIKALFLNEITFSQSR